MTGTPNDTSKLTPSQILSRINALLSGRVSSKYIAAEAVAAQKKKKARGGKVKKRK